MSDQNFTNVGLLLHCDGSNNSTTVTDSSGSPKTVSVFGDAKISTARSQFGGASLLFDGDGDYISIPAYAGLNTDTGDFTREFWYYPTDNSNNQQLIIFGADTLSAGTDIGFGVGHFGSTLSGKIRAYVYSGTTAYTVDSLTAPTLNQWLNGVFQMRSGVLELYIDGVQQATAAVSGGINYNSAWNLRLGKLDNGATPRYLSGSLDEIRFTEGVARYTGNFTPSASAFPDYGPDLTGGASASASATAGLDVSFIGQPTRGTLTITGHTPGFISTALSGDAQDSVSAAADLSVGFNGHPQQGVLSITGHSPGFVSRILQTIADNWLSTHYRCYLTGSADALADVELPIKSFQIRQNATRTFLSVVVPGVDAYQSAITARPNGSIKINRIYNYADGSADAYNIVNAAFDSLRIDSGGTSGMTGTLSAYATPPTIPSETVDLFDPTYYSSTDGASRRYRCRLDPRLRPGDTANINGESLVVGEIIQYVDTATTTMEIAEA